MVTGCYAQRAAHEIAALPGVSVSHRQFPQTQSSTDCARQHSREGHVSSQLHSFQSQLNSSAAAEDLKQILPEIDRARGIDDPHGIFVSDIFAHTELLAAPVFDSANERTRPNLKVQDGCDNRCSFCVIPSVRGQSRSLQCNKFCAK